MNTQCTARIIMYLQINFSPSGSLGLYFCELLKCTQGGCDCSVRVCNWGCRAANTRLSRLTCAVECAVHVGLR